MLKRLLLPMLLVVFCVGIFACEIDDDTIARTITSMTSIAFTKILDNNPELTDTFYVYAVLNKKVVIDREIDCQLANRMMSQILMDCKDLEEDDRQLILTLFNTIIPLIQIPEDGAMDERQIKFFTAFLDGIIQACETRKLVEPEPKAPPVEWEV